MFDDLYPIDDRGKPLYIAGPCAAESREQLLTTARAVAAAGVGWLRAGVWKPRTRPGSFEGAGDMALQWLADAKSETGLRTMTEVATPQHVEAALASGIDAVWIGARTTTNPFAVQQIADALQGVDIPVLVKNPVNPDVELWIGAVQRIYNAGIRRLAAIHRGFGSYEQALYRNPPHWSIPIELRRRIPSLPIVCDPSHMAGRAAGTTGHKHRLRRPDRRVPLPAGRCAERQCATAYPRRAAAPDRRYARAGTHRGTRCHA